MEEFMPTIREPLGEHIWIKTPIVETWISCPPLNKIPIEDFCINLILVLLYRILSSTNDNLSLTMFGWVSQNLKPPTWWTRRVAQLNRICEWKMTKVRYGQWIEWIKRTLRRKKTKVYHFPYSSLFICGKVLITTHLDPISYPFPSK